MHITWVTALLDIQIAPPLCWRISRNESAGGTIFERSKLNLGPPACSVGASSPYSVHVLHRRADWHDPSRGWERAGPRLGRLIRY